MGSDRGSCLSVVGSIVGILSGIVTIAAFFFSDGASFLEAMGELIPGVAGFLQGIADGVVAFAESWPVGPWLSAGIVILIVIVLRCIAEVVFDMCTVEVTLAGVPVQALVFLPLALVWIWIFSGVATTLGIAAYVGVYLLASVGAILLAEVVSDWV